MGTNNSAAIILAGGENLRFPKLKATVLLGGDLLINKIAALLLSLFDNVLIVGDDNRLNHLRTVMLALRDYVSFVSDVEGPRCPLRGLYSGLLASPAAHNFVVGCDMPFLHRELIMYMARKISLADVLIPRLGIFLEPLHAFYSKSCLPKIEKALHQGRKKMVSFLPYVRVEYVDQKEIRVFDPDGLSFFNLNTISDWTRAIEIERERAKEKCGREQFSALATPEFQR